MIRALAVSLVLTSCAAQPAFADPCLTEDQYLAYAQTIGFVFTGKITNEVEIDKFTTDHGLRPADTLIVWRNETIGESVAITFKDGCSEQFVRRKIGMTI